MNISPDYLIERRRAKKSLAKWKIFALLLITLLIFAVVGKNKVDSNYLEVPPLSDYIARAMIEEIILEDHKRELRLEQIASDDKVKALIIYINSPGGSVVGSEKLYNSFRRVAAKKPVVVVMGSLATSGGYMAAVGADYIIAHNGTITGSIGVILQSAEITKLAETLGIKFTNFKSGTLKATPNFVEEVTPEVASAIMANIYDVYDYFISLVAKRRNLDIDYVEKIADGRLYSGRQALELKLVDAVGDETEAVKWLQEVKGVNKGLKIVDVKLRPKSRLLDMLLEDMETIFPSIIMNKIQGLGAIFYQ